MIDLSRVDTILDDCRDLIAELQGVEHEDDGSNRGPRSEREEKVWRSRQLQFLADRLELARCLAMNEYWYARGEADGLDPLRDE